MLRFLRSLKSIEMTHLFVVGAEFERESSLENTAGGQKQLAEREMNRTYCNLDTNSEH